MRVTYLESLKSVNTLDWRCGAKKYFWEIVLSRFGKFVIYNGIARLEGNTIADFEMLDTFADFDNLSTSFMTKNHLLLDFETSSAAMCPER